MYRTYTQLFLLTLLLIIVSCDDTSQDTDPDTLKFSVESTEDLSFIINEAPGDYSWDYFSDNLSVSLVPGPMWSGEMVLSSLQVRNQEVVNRSSTPPVSVSIDELTSGLTSGELFPGLIYVPGQEWTTGKRWMEASKWPQAKDWISLDEVQIVREWIPERRWKPSKISEAAINEVQISDSQTLLVVYARLAAESAEREVTTKPYGIVFDTDLDGSF
jgi:hypothetical protein